MPEFQTERLHMRPYKPDEAALIYSLTGDLRVMFWRSEPGTLEEAELILQEKLRFYAESRMGFWAVFSRETGNFLGQVALQLLPETGEPEVGYHFSVESQGKGYATEAARRLLDYGFNDLALPRIVAVVLPDNKPSLAVMKKLGLPYMKDLMKGGMLHNYFALDRSNYPARQN